MKTFTSFQIKAQYNMSQTKYLVSGKCTLQDPEAILSMGSVSENDDKMLSPKNLGKNHVKSTVTDHEENSNGNSSKHKFEYPTVTINGKPTSGVKITTECDQSSIQRSRLHSVSEPDLTQVGLYCNHKDYNLTSAAHQQQEDIRRKIGIKIIYHIEYFEYDFFNN